MVGARQCWASGQQYVPASAHGDVHALPTATQIFVSGQHTLPPEQSPLSAHDVFVGVRQCFASGQQYSEEEHVLPAATARPTTYSTRRRRILVRQAPGPPSL